MAATKATKDKKKASATRHPRIFIVRHAIAAERGAEWPDDTKRPLTLKGITRMRKVVRGLRDLGVRVDLVVTSPLVRAKQTAALLVEGLRPRPKLAVLDVLAPGHSPRSVAEALAPFEKAGRLALVGHEPGLGELAAWLIGSTVPLPFKKGGVARIDATSWPPSGNSQLIWFVTPKMLRK
jgi:phosphohistidine phosphatase